MKIMSSLISSSASSSSSSANWGSVRPTRHTWRSTQFLIAIVLSGLNLSLMAQTDAPSAGVAAVPTQAGPETYPPTEPPADAFQPGAGGRGFGGVGEGKAWGATTPT